MPTEAGGGSTGEVVVRDGGQDDSGEGIDGRVGQEDKLGVGGSVSAHGNGGGQALGVPTVGAGTDRLLDGVVVGLTNPLNSKGT